jgi:hypothetical protein
MTTTAKTVCDSCGFGIGPRVKRLESFDYEPEVGNGRQVTLCADCYLACDDATQADLTNTTREKD